MTFLRRLCTLQNIAGQVYLCLKLVIMENTTMLHELTVTWRKVQINSLPLPNQNFPKLTNHIPGLFKHFQRLGVP